MSFFNIYLKNNVFKKKQLTVSVYSAKIFLVKSV